MFRLESTAFSQGGKIPAKYTDDGLNVSPPLAWSDLPAGTKSLALVVEDPDAPDPRAPKCTWVHWVLYDLPPETSGLAEAASGHGLPRGAREGLNDWQHLGYEGPSPPIGRQRYMHKPYAIDTVLPDLGRPTAAALRGALEGHILGEVTLTGTYEKATH